MADQEHDTPGEPPTIRDEAADSPMWLPALGLSLLLLGAVLVVWRGAVEERSANVEETAATESETTAETAAPDEAAANPDAAEPGDDPPDAPQ